MKVSEFANQSVVTVDKEVTVRDAAAIMREKHVGDLIVCEPEGGNLKPLGIITDRDIVIGVVALRLDPSILTTSDIMGPSLFVAEGDEDVELVIRHMRTKGIRRAPVVDADGYLAGIFTLDDYLDHLAQSLLTVRSLIKRERTQEEKTRLAVA
jgi:CBS domain-containing protein